MTRGRTQEPPSSRRESSTRSLLKVGAVAAVIGIALAVAGDDGPSLWLTLGGVALMVLGLHRFGRLGSDPPIRW